MTCWYCWLQDTSTGAIVAQHRTRMGTCDVLRQNPWNAVVQLGHSNGVVSMWTPNMSTPVVKMLCHKVRLLRHLVWIRLTAIAGVVAAWETAGSSLGLQA